MNSKDVPLLYVIIDEDCKIKTEADQLLVKVMKLREDESFVDDFEADDMAVYDILHTCLHGGDYSSIVDGPKRSGRKVFQTLSTRCAGIQGMWEYRNQAVSLSQKLHYKDEHSSSFQNYTSQWQKIFYLYYLAGEELSEGLKVAWFLDGLKAEDGSTVSISKSAMFSNAAYSEDLNKVIARLTLDIAGNKANRKAANYHKHNGKKPRFNVSEIGVDDPSPPKKPSKNPPGVDVSDPTKWFEKDDFAKLTPEWRKYCAYKRYEAKQKKIGKQKNDNVPNTDEKKVGKNNKSNRNKKNNKYIREVIAKQTAELEAKFEQKIAQSAPTKAVSRVVYRSYRQCEPESGRLVPSNALTKLQLASQQLLSWTHMTIPRYLVRTLLYLSILTLRATFCDVYGFSGTSKLPDVPIESGTTAWNDENGTTYTLVIHYALWMGSKLEHSLVNPNQVRFNGIRLIDDPTQNGIGIRTNESHIKMKMRGIVCYTNTRVPSEQELRECDRIVLRSPDGWDPHNITFPISNVET